MRRFVLLIALLFAVFRPAMATHQRAGEITYKWLGNYLYEVTIVTYTYTPSLADRPELTINWGDGTSDIVQRIEKLDLPNNISRNVYAYNGSGTGGRHNFAGPGAYWLTMEDPNRNYGIVNIPNSVNVPFFLKTLLVINPFLGGNSSPVLLNPPIDNACLNEIFIHNPWAYDAEGDSLAYRLDTCMGAGGLDIPGFTQPPASNSLTVNAINGDLIWDSPIYNGEYNVAMLIEEWRNGHLIGAVLRDLQITVVPCDNEPPVLTNVLDTCVEAGTFLSVVVSANDVDGDLLSLTGDGGPLQILISPATFPPANGIGSVSSTFNWQTECAHVKRLPYQANFRVEDNSYPVSLIDLSSLRITVVCPEPENLTATPVGTSIYLNWDPVICTNAIGYKVYRRTGYYGFFPDHCETGVPAYTGYQKIATLTGLLDTSYVDNNGGTGLIHGNDYCYMVIAYFTDSAESYASLEACASLKKDVPVITHVSVNSTSTTNGSIFIDWSKPTELDTVLAPGPYKYLIYRAPQLSGGSFALIDSTLTGNDTTYVDTLINTAGLPYRYRIDMWNDTPSNRFLIGSSHFASSVYLSLSPSDNKLTLNWDYDVPWVNDTTIIFRQNPVSLLYDSIGLSLWNTYTDTGLVNGQQYCYKVMTVGRYSAPGYVDPIENWSQEICGVPIDNEPPCPPVLTVTPNCEMITNFLNWTNPNHSCAGDVVQYIVYYTPDPALDYQLLLQVYNPEDTTYLHSGMMTIAGCYYVVAIDSFNNVSPYSNVVCLDIESCDIYDLPNILTPNGDGYNDIFVPFPYDFVESVNMTIFNRWGKKIFETNDPDINWDGRNQHSGQLSPDGVYFYICDVYERRLGGIVKRTLQGTVTILR